MASSILTGDRRWATTRKSGMTVLGKVPKPINLPSQRLENHGLDPNVEIVPKGTLTWGSRPSSTTPNAWGTSSISSPNADGSAGSPSHISGRPSSGGSGTRPSTAGSDKSHEPLCNAWGSNSRPSSASGILTSNQTSAAATRPRSADTRPGSSQLSRFADNSVDSTGACAWGPPGSAERLVGSVSSKASGFTLSSGDFPTLGSEKSSDSHSQRGHSSQGRPHSSQGRPLSSQGRPVSASGTHSAEREVFEPQLVGSRNENSLNHGNVDTWKADNPPYLAHDAPPNMENWHGDPRQPQPYPNMNMPPQYDSWHNPPFHPADGAWYRGGAAGGPYRPPGPPGSYPIDYVPPRPFVNSQPYPRRDAGPGGSYPNCEPYRPNMPPERYMGPCNTDVPARPGAYPGPVPYEGYYGPPHPNLYNSSDREVPIMGMSRPLVHNQYSNQHPNFDSGNFHGRPGGYGSVMNKEQIKHDQFYETQGQYRVLLKQHDGSEDRDEWVNEENSKASGPAHPQRGNHPGVPTHERHWETKSQTQVAAVSPNFVAGEVVPSQPSRCTDGQSSDTVVRKSVAGSTNTADDGLLRRPEAADVQSCGQQQYPIIRKNASLMEKVEGLNTKARIADGRNEDRPLSSKERTKYVKDAIARDNLLMKVVPPSATSKDCLPVHNVEIAVPKESNALKEDRLEESTTDEYVLSGPSNFVGCGANAHLSQKIVHGAKGVDHHPKFRSIRHDSDEVTKKTSGSESLINPTARICKVESDASQEAPSGKRELHHAAGVGDGSQTFSSSDPVQRAKTKEIAMQRAKQLQEEEERRTREQRAKALAKLEELNRRTLAENSNLNSSGAPPQSTDVQNDQESKPGELPIIASIGVSAGTSESVNHDDNSTAKPGAVAVAEPTSKACAEPSNSGVQTSVNSQDTTERVTLGVTSDTQNFAVSKQKQVSYRRKQSISPENSLTEKQPTSGSNDSLKDTGEVAVNASISLPNNEDPSVHLRKKHNRNARSNKNKLDEGLRNSTLLPQVDNKGNTEKFHSESGETNPLAAEAVSAPSEGPKDTVGTQSSTEEIPDTLLSQVSSETSEETRVKSGNNWKSQHHKKSARNQQPNKPNSKYHGTEAVIWAPVKPPTKNETQEGNQNSVIEATNSSGKSGHVQIGTKAKRAEIERYVPKPVAKELSQQVSQQTSSDMSGKPAAGSPSVESVKLDGTTVGKSVASDNRNANKHGRTNASWRQRTSAEPSVGGAATSFQTVSGSKVAEPVSNDSLPKGQLTDASDGWNDNYDNLPPSESITSTVVAKSSGMSRQAREQYKAQRGRGNNNPTSDHMDSQKRTADKIEHQDPVFGHNDLESRNITKNESYKAGGEQMKPHWQPKSQAYGQGRQGNRGAGGQRVASQGIENEGNDGLSQNNSVGGRNQVGGESKAISDASKEQTSLESAPPSVGHQHEQGSPFGVNQRRQYNGRFQRGHDSSYRVRDSGQDYSKQNFQPNGDKRKNNPHAEYQRTESSYGKPRDSFQQNVGSSEGHEGTQIPGSRYRERGQQYRRGGGGHFNAHGPNSAARAKDSFYSNE